MFAEARLWCDWKLLKGLTMLFVTILMAPFGVLNFPLSIVSLLVMVPLIVPTSPVVSPVAMWNAHAFDFAGKEFEAAHALTGSRRSRAQTLFAFRVMFQLLIQVVLSPLGLAMLVARIANVSLLTVAWTFLEHLAVWDN